MLHLAHGSSAIRTHHSSARSGHVSCLEGATLTNDSDTTTAGAIERVTKRCQPQRLRSVFVILTAIPFFCLRSMHLLLLVLLECAFVNSVSLEASY